MNYTELLNPQNSALILIDFQPGWGVRRDTMQGPSNGIAPLTVVATWLARRGFEGES